MRALFFIVIISFLSYCSNAQYPFKTTWSLDSLLQFADDTSHKAEDRMAAYNVCLWRIVYKDWNKGLKLSQTYYQLAKKSKQKNRQVLALHFLGFSLMMKGELNESNSAFLEAYRLAEELNDPLLITDALNDLGNLEESKENYDDALIYYDKALKLAVKHKIALTEARSIINVGNIYELQGDYKKSLEKHQQALLLCKKHKYNGYLSSVYEHIGKIYLSINELNLAEKYFQLSYQQSFNPENLNKRIIALENLAILEQERKNFDQSLNLLNTGLKLMDSLTATRVVAKIHYLIADVYFIKNDQNNAVKHIREAEKNYESDADKDAEIDFYLIAGKIFMKLEKYNEAEHFFLKGYHIASKNKNVNALKVSTGSLYEIYKVLKNPNKSFKFLQEFVHWHDIVRNDEEVREVVKLEFEEEFQKKRIKDSISATKKANEIKEENDLKIERQKANTKIVYIVLLFVIGLFLISGYVLFKIYQNRKTLQEKNKIITNALTENKLLLKEVNHRVKNNLQIVSSMIHFKMKKTISEDARVSLNDTKLRINAMMIAHQKMYIGTNNQTLELKEYLTELVNMLQIQTGVQNSNFQVLGNTLVFDIEKAQSLGFVIHELVINSVKYAWSEEKADKKIIIDLKLKEKELLIDYSDNGCGLPKEFSFDTQTSFGLNIVKSIVTSQLMGEIEQITGNGAHFKIRIEINE